VEKASIFSLLYSPHIYTHAPKRDEENVSNTSLNALVNNRFAAADLVGKNVNIDMELSNATITDMAMLKKLTGNSLSG
jgi:hypothetical protein